MQLSALDVMSQDSCMRLSLRSMIFLNGRVYVVVSDFVILRGEQEANREYAAHGGAGVPHPW